jgi:hypothetical protein
MGRGLNEQAGECGRGLEIEVSDRRWGRLHQEQILNPLTLPYNFDRGARKGWVNIIYVALSMLTLSPLARALYRRQFKHDCSLILQLLPLISHSAVWNGIESPAVLLERNSRSAEIHCSCRSSKLCCSSA